MKKETSPPQDLSGSPSRTPVSRVPCVPMNPDSGSVILGLCFLVCALMLSGLFVFTSAHTSATVEKAAERRADLLQQASETTQRLNRISANNALILAHLVDAVERYGNALGLATNFQLVIPFWKAGFLGKELKEQEPVAKHFAATSKNFADLLATARALAQDSRSMQSELKRNDPRWGSSLREGTLSQALCKAIGVLAQENKATSPSVLKSLIQADVRYSTTPTSCSVSIGTHTLFDPEFLLTMAQVPKDLGFGMMTLQLPAPLEIPVPAQVVTWKNHPLTALQEWPDSVGMGRARIVILHPDLQRDSSVAPSLTSEIKRHQNSTVGGPSPRHGNRTQNTRELPMLTPHWVPAYLTHELGG